MEILKTYKYQEELNALNQALTRPFKDAKTINDLVCQIFINVRDNKDKALKEYAKTFDKTDLKEIKVTTEEITEAISSIDQNLKNAITTAYENIRKFHINQYNVEKVVNISEGIQCWRKNAPIEKVGLYIPGGSAPLFSTVLMLSIPANIAGCKDVSLCTPPNKEGKIHPAILFAANLCGVKNIYKVGGAQAIAAMAFGTESINKVYKIFGPGNQYVTAAKQLAIDPIWNLGLAIDMPAGPSEVLVYIDSSGVAAYAAADLLSQAEHGADSQVVLVSSNENILNEVRDEVKKQLELLPRKNIAEAALNYSVSVLVKDKEEAIQMINDYAPEHLILQTKEEDFFIERIVNAGSVFIGNFTPESAGDYASGTNHTLPTNGYARSHSGVSVDSFIKKITFQKISEEGLKELGPTIEIMAEAEELMAHKNAVSIRLKKK